MGVLSRAQKLVLRTSRVQRFPPAACTSRSVQQSSNHAHTYVTIIFVPTELIAHARGIVQSLLILPKAEFDRLQNFLIDFAVILN